MKKAKFWEFAPQPVDRTGPAPEMVLTAEVVAETAAYSVFAEAEDLAAVVDLSVSRSVVLVVGVFAMTEAVELDVGLLVAAFEVEAGQEWTVAIAVVVAAVFAAAAPLLE